MNSTTVLFATATASEELPTAVWPASVTVFLLACVCALGSLLAAWRSPRHRLLSVLAATAIAFGTAATAFAHFVYRLDYVAVGGDGTEASEPEWRTLWLPASPLAAGLAALWLGKKRRPALG